MAFSDISVKIEANAITFNIFGLLASYRFLKWSIDAGGTGLPFMSAHGDRQKSFGLYCPHFLFPNWTPFRPNYQIILLLFCSVFLSEDVKWGTPKMPFPFRGMTFQNQKSKIRSCTTISAGCIKVCTHGPQIEKPLHTFLNQKSPLLVFVGLNGTHCLSWSCKRSLIIGPRVVAINFPVFDKGLKMTVTAILGGVMDFCSPVHSRMHC